MAKTKIGKVAITPKKQYSANTGYTRLDIVTYNGSSYLCLKDCTGIAVTNTEYWQLIAQKGDKPVKGVDYLTEVDKQEFEDKVVEDSKTDITKHTEDKKTELDNHTTSKKTSLENDLDAYTDTKKTELDTKQDTINTELNKTKDTLVAEVKKAQDGFGENVTTKTDAFNTNAEKKTTEFNNNAKTQTDTFNSNADEKIADYNSNTITKVEDYNRNAEAKVNEFNQSVDRIKQENQDYKENLLLKETEFATEHKLEDSANGFCEIEFAGNTEQDTTTGKNLIPNNFTSQTINGVDFVVKEDGTIIANGTATDRIIINILDGNLTDARADLPELHSDDGFILSGCPTGGSSSTYKVDMWSYAGESIMTIYGGENKTNKTDIRLGRVRIVIYADAVLNNLEFKIMLRNSKITDDTYEKYTGGEKSPNFDFLQKIKRVKNKIAILMQNQNLVEGIELGGYDYTTGNKLALTNVIRCNKLIEIDNSKTYYFWRDDTTISLPIGVRWYDKDKNYIGATTLNINNQSTFWKAKNPTAMTNAKYVTFQCQTTNLDAKFMIAESNVAIDYIAPQNKKIILDLKDKELFKDDKISGKLDEWYFVFSNFRGDTSTVDAWVKGSASNDNYSVFQASWQWSRDANLKPTINGLYADKLNVKNNNIAQKDLLFESICVNTGTNPAQLRISVNNNRLETSDSAGMLKYMKNNRVEFVGKMTKDKMEKITDTELIEQLNELYLNARTYKNITYISTNVEEDNVQPMLKIKYNQDLRTVLDNMQAMILDNSTN